MPTRRAIDARDLDPATRAPLGIGAKGEGKRRQEIAEALQARRQRDERAIARKRGHTGKTFEGALGMTHRQYELLKWGKLWAHAPPFLRIKGEWRPKAGGGPVDYTGHVHAVRVMDEHVGTRVRGIPGNSPIAHIIPVAFDAKVQDAKSSIYHHERKRHHQLLALKEASNTGTAAFLLVFVPQIDRVVAIDVATQFRDIILHGVRLYDRARTPLFPSIARGATSEIAEWDWIPLLDRITNGRV